MDSINHAKISVFVCVCVDLLWDMLSVHALENLHLTAGNFCTGLFLAQFYTKVIYGLLSVCETLKTRERERAQHHPQRRPEGAS